MSQKPLNKIYHFDKNSYDIEYTNRFNNSNTIHFDFKIKDNDAFLCQNIEIYKQILSIERANNLTIQLSEQLPPIALVQYSQNCLIDEIIVTNNIEGVYSTRKEVAYILNDVSKKDKEKRFWGIVNKYKKLLSDDCFNFKSCQDIRNLYDEVFLDEIKHIDIENYPDGEIFRKNSVCVLSETQKVLHNGLSSESKIIEYMTKSLEFLNDESVELIIRIAIFHYMFGYIHPFYDGNGRLSRLIGSMLLSQKYNFLIAFKISSTIKEKLHNYYNAFKICNDTLNKGDLTPFVEMFLDVIESSFNHLNDDLEEQISRLSFYEKFIPDLPNGKDDKYLQLYYVLIQSTLFSNNGICRNDICEHLEIGLSTVRRRLSEIPTQFIIKNKLGREIFYSANLDEIRKYLKL